MSTIFCKYHPKTAARWECPDCDITICGSCATKDTVRNTAQCPVCKSPLQAVNATNFIEPFWKRIPKFFKYPANGQSLIFIGVIGFFLAFAPFGGFMSVAMMILLGLAFTRYAMLVLEYTADGRNKPPDVSINMITSGHLVPLKMMATYFVFGFVVVFLGNSAGSAAAVVMSFLVLACLPASTMVIATTQSFIHAINPLMLLGIIRAIGKPYWIMYGFLILLSACQTAVTSIVGAVDSFLLWPVQNAIGLYFTLIMFNMMGYVIFQYHEQLGYSVRMEVDQDYGDSARGEKPKASHPALQEAELLVKEGNLDEAIYRLRSIVSGSNVPLEVRAYYHQLLRTSGQAEAMVKHAKEYLNVLLYQNKTSDAARLVVDCFKHKEIIRPADPDKIYTLAYALKDIRAFRECMALINNFHGQHPGHPDIPRLYLLGARVLSE
ncbi:MAG: hypothetical protein PVH98_11345, partial [Gammaproteobacteria bacterium]